MKKNYLSDPVTKGYLEDKLFDLEVSVNKKATQYGDEIVSKLDDVIGELATMRDENTIGSYQIRELRKTQVNHDRRLKKLEQVQKAP